MGKPVTIATDSLNVTLRRLHRGIASPMASTRAASTPIDWAAQQVEEDADEHCGKLRELQ